MPSETLFYILSPLVELIATHLLSEIMCGCGAGKTIAQIVRVWRFNIALEKPFESCLGVLLIGRLCSHTRSALEIVALDSDIRKLKATIFNPRNYEIFSLAIARDPATAAS